MPVSRLAIACPQLVSPARQMLKTLPTATGSTAHRNPMEPNLAGARPNRMPANTPALFADNTAIHVFGTAQCTCATELGVVAATLNSIAPPQFGPVGARFVAAFAAAVNDHAKAVANLGRAVHAAGLVAHGNADGYVAAEQRACLLLPQVSPCRVRW